MKIAVALSGGVDSAVAAALLQSEGHEIGGLTMRVREPDAAVLADEGRAATLCERLGIPFRVVDLRSAFEERIVAPFVAAYRAGRTPNPCVSCNEHIKLGLLFEMALAEGWEGLATGHYARLRPAPGGQVALWRGVDPRKDQSYFLARVPASRLARLRFPLGDWRKEDVRAEAVARGLDMVPRTESQEICFVGPEGAGAEVARRGDVTNTQGPIVDETGRELGRHAGIHHFTVGQRKGLGVAAAHPLYVLRIEAEERRVVVGPAAACRFRRVRARDAVWTLGAPPGERFRVTVQIRYRHAGSPAEITVRGDEVEAHLAEAAVGVAPGQSLVLYDGERVLGAAWIEAGERDA